MRTPNGAFMRPGAPRARLGSINGDKRMARKDVPKMLWAYLRESGLWDK